MSIGDQNYFDQLRVGHYCVHPGIDRTWQYGKGFKFERLAKPKQGWVCPKCDSVYAPYIPECSRCNSNASVG